jgi:hypothetical protein
MAGHDDARLNSEANSERYKGEFAPPWFR